MQLKKRRSWFSAGIVYAVLAVLFLYPLLGLIVAAFTRDGTFSIGNFVAVFRDVSNIRALRNSAYIGIITTFFSSAIALVLSWLVVRTNIYFKRFLRFILVMPFFIPPFIMAYAWTRLLGRAGYLNVILQDLFGFASPPVQVYGAFGVILVSVIYTYPYAYIVISRGMENLGAHLEEAAQISGASKLQVIRDVVLPVLMPAVGSAAVIVFVTTVSMFGIPAIMGTPGRFIVITTRIYGYVGGFRDPHGMGIATTLSIVLVGFAFVGLLLQNFFTRKEKFMTITGKSGPIEETRLRAWRLPLTVILLLFCVVVVVLPLMAIGATSVIQALGVPFVLENLTLSHYVDVFNMSVVRRAIGNSFSLAVIVPTICSLGAVILVFLKRRGRMPGRNATEYIVSMPYAIPGIVIGVAMILAWRQPFYGVTIYNTIYILLFAYIIRFMIFPSRTVSAAWKQLDTSLEEAGRISGAGEYRTLRDISMPLIKGGIASGWLLVFMPALSELTLSILLYSPGNETIGVTAFNVMQEGRITRASAYAMIIAVIVIVLNLVVRVASEARRARS